MMKSHSAHAGSSTCSSVNPRSSILLIRQSSFINPARSSVLLATMVQSTIIHSCSFVPVRSFLLVCSCSFVLARSFLLVRSCLFVSACLPILLATNVQTRTGHRLLHALQVYEQVMDAQSHHVSRV